MRTVSMDGDDYGIIVPYRENWGIRIQDQSDNNGFFQQRFPATNGDQISLLYMKKQGHTVHEHGFVPAPSPTLLAAFREFINKEEGFLELRLVSKVNRKILPFYPMLVPLDKNGFLDTFQKTNQVNGSVVTGGSFLLNGKQVKINQVNRLKSGDTLEVADSTGSQDYDVTWVWANGCMVCWNTLFSCTAQYLMDSNLLGGDIL